MNKTSIPAAGCAGESGSRLPQSKVLRTTRLAIPNLMNCPACMAPAAPTNNFCEECGAQIATILHKELGSVRREPVPDCAACNADATFIDSDGFCARCGLQRRATERDHLEVSISRNLAGVSDRGLKHFRNEDFFAISQAGAAAIAVLCDGVSSSLRPDEAAKDGALAARDSLCASLQPGQDSVPEEAMRTAINAAQLAVKALASASDADNSPASTIVAAALIPDANQRYAMIGWLGDSRAYFIDRDGAKLLTKDHSWANEMVDAGKMTLATAMQRNGAHSITKTLGGTPAEEDSKCDEPSIIRFNIPGPGWLVLCSDGLWNYSDKTDSLAQLSPHSHPGDDALLLARDLVNWAYNQGGRDNITVVAIGI